ncbi:Serine/threonine-protein kinase PknB [Stieleria maiorica]|uniref:Serine/threonine-protein kinase PknB n=1 Tax=Stieleria maiorica TaxID=2795974 RepID=A0A5B9MB41_9BACT|nr:serine/threonine-protein kinase [Stieleria maiorica]QEF96397.1 Serine/threonine-protein kinase PknB [Stieleria maiorica]
MSHPSPRTVFLEALDQETADQREAYLASVCGDDAELRASVESLLAAHERPANPLDQSPLTSPLDPTLVADLAGPSEHIGMTIGVYRLMEQIGEGGFGLVFVAQQEKPVRRKVALKIIKPGTGSQEVLARFDAERQAVAMMDHPNIARVFDAGVTKDARPYFVMELVRGEPVTDFCDRHGLSLRDRLQLFQDVCAATHHAHQKGVVHRDLKPSNVMVTLHDDKPVVKVIDFGVAKAMGQSLTDATIYTRFYSMIGTPLYMSPEQAAMSGLDVDTRSDIYSLGVLLYELLTGTTPFDRKRLDSAGYDEMRRIIREEDPPKPSTRLTTIQSLNSPTVTAPRESEPQALKAAARRESIPSDLDWIVMKAMEKDRNRRYESAAAMSADVRRFLSEEPIEARPPSRGYRLRKFAARNRAALLTGSLVAAALVVGTAVSLYQASVAIAERNEKEIALRDAINARQEVESFTERLKTANVLLGNARSYEDSQQYAAADAAYSEAVDLVPNYYLVWVQRAALRGRLHLWDEAADDFAAAMRLEAPIDSRQWEGAAAIFHLGDRTDDYRAIYSRLMEPPTDNPPPLNFHSIRACLISPADVPDARQLAAEIESMLARSAGPPGGPWGPGSWGRPNRDRDFRRDGTDRGPRPPGPDGFDFNRPEPGEPPPAGPGFSGPEPGGGPRRPSFEDRVPQSVMQYVAAWASLRAGEEQKALEHLDAASNSRGPSGDMVHSLRAIALHRTGETEQATAEMRRADNALDKAISEAIESPDRRRPWIDLLEMIILHREATREVLGTDAELDPRLVAAQKTARDLLQL